MNRRILHILSQRPSHTGSGTTLDAIVRHASAAGWLQDVIVGTPWDDADPAVGALASDTIHPLRFGRPPLAFALPGMSDVMPYVSSRFAELSPAQLKVYCDTWRGHVAGVIDAVKPEVIHSHHIWLLSSMLKDNAPDVPVVTHCHGTGLRQLELCPHLADEVIAGCRRNDHFLALHRQQAEQIGSVLDVDSSRITVVGAGYRDAVFHSQGRQSAAAKNLVYAGKLSDSKGVPQLLDAMEILRRDDPGVVLDIAGSGASDEADAIKQHIESLQPNVTWHGQLSPDELADLLRTAAVFVLPSFYEGLPLVVAEAVACGCRVVASDLPGVREFASQLNDAIEIVPLPPMETIDQPRREGLPDFVQNLATALRETLTRSPLVQVEKLTAPMRWQQVCHRIENLWRSITSA